MPGAQLLGLSTAVPPHILDQAAVAERARRLFALPSEQWVRIAPIYKNAEVHTRYSAVPITWYLEPHGPEERNLLYLSHALSLLQNVAEQVLKAADCPASDISGVVVVSSTGIATPSLDARLISRLALPPDVERLPVFGLGCAGGVLGLNRTMQLAESRPGASYLLLIVELCGLTFRSNDASKSNIIATALFGDGAAGAVVRADSGTAAPENAVQLIAGGEYTWPDSLDIMGWDVRDDGWGVVFSRDIPHWVRSRMYEAAAGFLQKYGFTLADMSGFLCHPGGAKVINALQELFGQSAYGLSQSRNILSQYGNMSAPTVLFVLEAARVNAPPGYYLMTALGPGFSAGFTLLHLS